MRSVGHLAILAQVGPHLINTMFLIFVGALFLWCACRCSNVPYCCGGASDDPAFSCSPLLPAGRPGVECLHRADRGPWTGLEVARGPSSPSHCGGLGSSSTARWFFLDGGSGGTCGTGLPIDSTDPAHPSWRKLGTMGTRLSLWRPAASTYGNSCSRTSADREKTENDSGTGSIRRQRFRGHARGHEGALGSALHPCYGGLASRRRRSDTGTNVCPLPEIDDPADCALHRLQRLGALRAESFEGKQVQNLHPHGLRVRHEGTSRPSHLRSMESKLQSTQDGFDQSPSLQGGYTPWLRDGGGKTRQDIPHSVALGLQWGRTSQVIPLESHQAENGYGRALRGHNACGMGPKHALGLRLQPHLQRRHLLAASSTWTGTCVVGCREPWKPEDTCRTSGSRLHERWGTGNHPVSRWVSGRRCSWKGLRYRCKKKHQQKPKRSPKAESCCRQRGAPGVQGQEHRHEGWLLEGLFEKLGEAEVLRLEQRERAMRRPCTRPGLCEPGSTRTQMHHLRQPRPSITELPTEEEMTRWVVTLAGSVKRPRSEEQKGEDEPPDYDPSDASGPDDPDDPGGKKDEGEGEEQGDEGDEVSDGMGDRDPLYADTLEEYYGKRVFVFVHHYAGSTDPLTKAMKSAAVEQGIKLKAVSVERDSGTGDLLEDEPYNTHLRWAKNGNIDAYHAGFPCNTFSVLRFRDGPNLPRPIRTKEEPYGCKYNTEREQKTCDDGTVMACRAINMAKAVADTRKISKIPSIATLENPPPTNKPMHLSAWELPEMQEFINIDQQDGRVTFNTCTYEMDIPRGLRHSKPQMFAGTLLGMKDLERRCECGDISNHDPVVGIEKSRASATYPQLLCKVYARLAVKQLKMIGKSEFLELRMRKLQGSLQRGITVTETDRNRSRSRPKRYRKVRKRVVKDENTGASASIPPDAPTSSGVSANTPSGGGTSAPASFGPAPSQVDPKDEGTKEWIGGEGKHSALKTSSARTSDPRMFEFHGGLRDPYAVVRQMSNLKSLGIRIRASWEVFEKKFKNVTMVAEAYGTEDCEIQENLVKEWKSQLRKAVGANAPPAVKIKPRWAYSSPLDAEIFKAWARKGNDPETEVASWIEKGTPLGIERPIGTCGIFPPATFDTDLQATAAEAEAEDAAIQLSKGDINNYTSVSENLVDARIEIDRLTKEGYLRTISRREVDESMGHGTISRLGLIVKEKPTGKKRRIIIDMRRSGGNSKMTLPERLVLPRPRDAVQFIRETYAMREHHGMKDEVAKELAVIDISDAFMSLGLDEAELPHTLTPSIDDPEVLYLFPALLFGFKTAPLLWSRVAAQIARFLQSLFDGHEARHAVYLDDSIWLLQGSLPKRNSYLAMILFTMHALGLRVALRKGERSRQVTWIGVRFTIGEDSVTMAIPEKYTKEVLQDLESWKTKGMVATKDLQKMAGRISWLAGILPRARWVVSTFYSVLYSRKADIASGAEESRRAKRADDRDKAHFVAVKQFEQARAWLVAYLGASLERPVKPSSWTSRSTRRLS